jgi:hypothetical protein
LIDYIKFLIDLLLPTGLGFINLLDIKNQDL